MDFEKVDRIQQWVARTAEAVQSKRAPLTPEDLPSNSTARGSPFARAPRAREQPAHAKPSRVDVRSGEPSGGGIRSRRSRRRDKPSCRHPSQQTCNDNWDFVGPSLHDWAGAPPRAPGSQRTGLLIDVRTLSEIDRDEAAARARTREAPRTRTAVATRSSSSTRAHQSNPNTFAPQTCFASASIAADLKQLLTSLADPGTQVPQDNMANADDKPSAGYVPPHLRARKQKAAYIPPHLRKTSQRNQDPQPPLNAAQAPQTQLSYAQAASQPAPSNNAATQPSSAFQAARDKWASAAQPHPDGGVSLGGTAQPVAAHTPASGSMVATASAVTGIHASENAAPSQNISYQSPVATRATANDHGPRKQQDHQPKPKRNNKWVSNKEIRDAANNSSEPAGVWNSSDPGFNSNPDNDPEHDVRKLVDWEGNWLPGPIDWECRRSYRHSNFNEEMMRFVIDSVDKDAAIDLTKEPAFLHGRNGEVAPHVWASIYVEGASLQEWWNNQIGSPMSDPESKAWWRSYSSNNSSLLTPLEVPEARVDPLDEENPRYEADLGVEHACQQLLDKKNKKKEDKEKRRKREREAAAATAASIKANFVPLPTIKPGVSLFIRPALAADAAQIAGIYNHYVDKSVRPAETTQQTAHYIARRISEETGDGMPWLVACSKGKRNNRGYLNGTDTMILGFACASDYEGRRSIYAYVAEAEVYVHPHFEKRHVGACLMDRLMYTLDPFYELKDGYQFTGTGPFAEHGGSRVICSVVVHVPYDSTDDSDLKSVQRFLGQFNFKQEADLPEMGIKLGKNIDLAIFRHRTGCTVNPATAFIT